MAEEFNIIIKECIHEQLTDAFSQQSWNAQSCFVALEAGVASSRSINFIFHGQLEDEHEAGTKYDEE